MELNPVVAPQFRINEVAVKTASGEVTSDTTSSEQVHPNSKQINKSSEQLLATRLICSARSCSSCNPLVSRLGRGSISIGCPIVPMTKFFSDGSEGPTAPAPNRSFSGFVISFPVLHQKKVDISELLDRC